MSLSPCVVFLINQLQDVNVVRPLAFMVARDLRLRTSFLVSGQFVKRDSGLTWQGELKQIAKEISSRVLIFDNEFQAIQLLQHEAGVLVAASESDLNAHKPVHDIFHAVSSSFLKITLQHGFECPGLLHNRAHDLVYGRHVTFAADIVCGWCDGSILTSMAPSQRAKLYVSGPPTVLQSRRDAQRRKPQHSGLVCENLHSVRLSAGGDVKSDFVEIFNRFCRTLDQEGRKVVLRPHPGGQYVLKKNLELPPNVLINNHPIYKVDLGTYAYGISAPSSILLDMVFAGLPVAVWHDQSSAIDTGNYTGLTEISTASDWVDFSREAVSHPQRFTERQERFLEGLRMPTDPKEVHSRFARLITSAIKLHQSMSYQEFGGDRVLFVANANIPTYQLSFVKPLAPLVQSGTMTTALITEQQMRGQFGAHLLDSPAQHWLDRQFATFRPTLIVFCRYSGPHADHMVELARRENIPVVYHIDDDLLNIPIEIGLDKHKEHNDPQRLNAVRFLLDNSDLVYVSTKRLKGRLETLTTQSQMVAGDLYCSGSIITPAMERPVRKVGYMGFDHSFDFEIAIPALVAYLRRNNQIRFELFGSIPKPAALEEFGDRIGVIPPVRNYESFLKAFSELGWDIGITPLQPTPFNLLKADTKWVEYTSIGAAVIASRGTVYDECCSGGCGLLATTADEWLQALEKLTRDPAERFAQVRRAQEKLLKEYSVERLRDQVLEMFSRAKTDRSTQPSEADTVRTSG